MVTGASRGIGRAMPVRAEHGFSCPETEFAVAVARVAVGRAVTPVTTIAHQLHGAIGVTAKTSVVIRGTARTGLEQRLWNDRRLRASARTDGPECRRAVRPGNRQFLTGATRKEN